MEIFFCLTIMAVKLVCDCLKEKKANKYADMVVRR